MLPCPGSRYEKGTETATSQTSSCWWYERLDCLGTGVGDEMTLGTWCVSGREKGNSFRRMVIVGGRVLDLRVSQADPVQLFWTSAPLWLHRHCGAFGAMMGYLQESSYESFF